MKDIHITDLNAFTGCRRRWDWQSMLRMGLQRAVVPEPLFTGLGVHIGLDAYHTNNSNVYAAVASLRKWVLGRANAIEAHSGQMWDSERTMINDSYRLSVGMLKHYHMWHTQLHLDSKWEVLSTEELFEVPIPLSDKVVHACSSYRWLSDIASYDVSSGKWLSKRIQLAGRFDGLIRDRETGHIYLLEFKTTRSLSNCKWVMRGLQGTAYVYAAMQKYGDDVKGILYRFLRKKVPTTPKLLKRGGYSQAKSQDTSFRYFKQYLRREASGTGRDVNELYRENECILRHLHGQPEKFFVQYIIRKTDSILSSALDTIYNVGIQMVNPRVSIFANPGWSTCAGCPFQDPCDLVELGHHESAMGVLEAEYAPRRYWNE